MNRVLRPNRSIASAGTLAAVLALFLTGAARADAEVNVSGTWKAVYHCEAGSCAGGNYPAEPTFVQEKGSSVVHQQGAPGIVASVSGNVLTIEENGSGYKFKQTVTISADCQSWSGTICLTAMGPAAPIPRPA